jgi:hypothetical protein
VNAYLWLKLLHVLAAIIAVGTNVTYFVWLRLVRNSPTDHAFILNGLFTLDRRLANPAYILLPLTGIIMVLIGDLGSRPSGSRHPSSSTLRWRSSRALPSHQRCGASYSWRNPATAVHLRTPQRRSAPPPRVPSRCCSSPRSCSSWS